MTLDEARRTEVDAGDLVEATLSRYRTLALERMLETVPADGPRYLYDVVRDYLQRPAKGMRPALCLAACGAWGGDVGAAVGTATAVELLHNAFLVFDDVQDESELRRGSPSLQSEYGVGVALNVGNALYVLAFELLRANRSVLGPTLTERIIRETLQMMRHTLEGQAIEIGWIRDNASNLDAEDYYRMCLKKTSWYSCIYPLRIGSLIATRGVEPSPALYRFGWYLGAAFQIRDDVLNLIGETELYGKERGGDLWEGKRTLMLIHQLQRRPTPARLDRYLRQTRAERSVADVRWLHSRMESMGSIEYAGGCAGTLADAALAEAPAAFASATDNDDLRFLLAMPEYVIQRQR